MEINKVLLRDLLAKREQSRESRLRHKHIEDTFTAQILDMVGYDPRNEEPETIDVPGIVTVKVTAYRDVDTDVLREKYPDVYAACERTLYRKTINPA